MKYLGKESGDMQNKNNKIERIRRKVKPGVFLEEKASQLLRDSWLSWNSGSAFELPGPLLVFASSWWNNGPNKHACTAEAEICCSKKKLRLRYLWFGLSPRFHSYLFPGFELYPRN
jgi:hypothetical protein